jgi:hypothetical protein
MDLVKDWERKFIDSWKQDRPWLHHNVEQNVMVCNWCIETNGRSLVSSGATFLFNGFPCMDLVLYFKKAMTTVFWSDKMFQINDDC